jgi:hypothetical protein
MLGKIHGFDWTAMRVERCNLACIDRYQHFIVGIIKMYGQKIPHAQAFRLVYQAMDGAVDFKLSHLKDHNCNF